MEDPYQVTAKIGHTDLLRDSVENYEGADLTVKRGHTDLKRDIEENEGETSTGVEASLEDLVVQLKQL